MSSLNPAKNKAQISLFIILPLLAALALATAQLLEALKARSDLQKLDVLLEYTAMVAPVVTSLQQERLLTAFYLETRSTDVTELNTMKDKIADSRIVANVAVDNYKAFIEQKDRFSEFPLLMQDLRAIEEFFDLLEPLRSVVDKKLKNMPYPDPDSTTKLWPLGILRNMLDTLVNSSKQVVVLTNSVPELSRLANAYQNIINAKNTANVTYDVVYHGITFRVNGSRYGGIVRSTEVERIYVDNFLNFAPPYLAEAFQTSLTGQAFYNYYLDLLEQVRARATRQIGEPIEADINEWATSNELIQQAYDENITLVIDAIRSEKIAENQRALFALLQAALVIVALLIALSTVIVIMRQSSRELGAEAS